MAETEAQEGHPFLQDVKDAYKASRLAYDANVERLLFGKFAMGENADQDRILGQTLEALYRQFFMRVKTGVQYCPVEEIKKYFGQSPEERIGISSGGYYRLFVAYWTLKAKLTAYHQTNQQKHRRAGIYSLDEVIGFMEHFLAVAFFPTHGPGQMPEPERRRQIQKMLDAYAPRMTIRELYEGADPQEAGWPILK